jgi:hypothetical protein
MLDGAINFLKLTLLTFIFKNYCILFSGLVNIFVREGPASLAHPR